MSPGVAIMVTGVLVAVACSLLGTFLVLRRMAMMADAISHAILPGLVVGYALAGGPNLWLAVLGAAAASIVLVTVVERVSRTGRVANDAAIGLTFSAMFAFGTFLISRFFADVHLDTDAVLTGNIEFTGFDRLVVGTQDLGPKAVWVMGGLGLANLAFVALFFKELKLATFDPALSATLGFAPAVVHYGLMALVSVTAVGAFSAVGAVLVIAFMIVPAATALLLTRRLGMMIVLSVACGAASALLGYVAARRFDTSVSGMMATMTGVLFAAALLFSPVHGVVARARWQARQRQRFAVDTLVVRLVDQEGAGSPRPSTRDALLAELRWSSAEGAQVLASARRAGYVTGHDALVELTPAGRRHAEVVLSR